jgi:hypothetical protein
MSGCEYNLSCKMIDDPFKTTNPIARLIDFLIYVSVWVWFWIEKYLMGKYKS